MAKRPKKRSKFANWMRLIRWANTLAALFCVYVGFSFGADNPSAGEWVVVLFSVGFIFAGGNALNDYVDAQIDESAHPKRPLPSGALKREKVRKVGINLISIGVLIALGGTSLFGLLPASIALLAAGLLVLYDLYFKRVPLLGNAVVGLLGAMVFIYTGTVQGLAPGHLYAAGFAFLFHVGREIVKDIADLPFDEAAGIRTLPARIGATHSAKIATFFLLIIVPLSIVPYFTKAFSLWYLGAVIMFADLPLLLFAWMLPQSTSPSAASKMASDLKWVMVGGLFALLLGGLTS